MNFSFTLKQQDNQTRARVGTIFTSHGEIQTPAFSPVGTRATVRALSVDDLKATGSQVVLANTYHLYLYPGTDVIQKFGGFGPFMKWDGPTITDSGGYQVSFLWNKHKGNDRVGERHAFPSAEFASSVKITDEGALFKSHLDGSEHLLTPEKSMEIQHILGADIIMALDHPVAKEMSEKQIEDACRRTFLWEQRSFDAWQKLEKERKSGSFQALFGILQGGLNKVLRTKFLKFVLDTGFPGIAIGDETIGVDPNITAASLDTIVDLLPDDKPLHALGLGGGPEGIFKAIERGVDMFDNTSITRMARAGLLFIYPEDGGAVGNKFRIDITKQTYKDKKKPVSKVCNCSTCKSYSSAYVHHLIKMQEFLGFRLASMHNIYFINELMRQIREVIMEGKYKDLRDKWLEV